VAGRSEAYPSEYLIGFQLDGKRELYDIFGHDRNSRIEVGTKGNIAQSVETDQCAAAFLPIL